MIGYDYYRDSYLGDTIPETEFPALIGRAFQILEKFSGIYDIRQPGPEGKAMALCAMAETLYRHNRNRDGISAASAGKISVRYEREKTSEKALLQELYNSASVYLDFYRGVSHG